MYKTFIEALSCTDKDSVSLETKTIILNGITFTEYNLKWRAIPHKHNPYIKIMQFITKTICKINMKHHT